MVDRRRLSRGPGAARGRTRAPADPIAGLISIADVASRRSVSPIFAALNEECPLCKSDVWHYPCCARERICVRPPIEAVTHRIRGAYGVAGRLRRDERFGRPASPALRGPGA